MKILQISPHTTCNDVPLLNQCKSGFGYMTFDIASALSKEAAVEELLYNYRYQEFQYGGILFLENTFKRHLKYVLRCSNPFIPFCLWWKYKMHLRTFVRLVYVWLISGYFYHVIKKGNYDIVQIHGCTLYDEILMDICRRSNQKFVVTLHGLNSFSDSVNLEPAGKKYERDFLYRVANGEFPITVISSGMKHLIENTYKEKKCQNVFVVCNAFNFNDKVGGAILNVKEKYGIPPTGRILLYVGNISKNKNQEQMIKAFGLLPEVEKVNTYVLFCGRNLTQDYTLDKIVANHPYRNHLVLCGNVDKQYMDDYYKAADGVVLLSYAEGFGLSLIEAMHFGKPCLTFEDIDAFDDIYNERVVVGIQERSDEKVASGIVELMTTNWDNIFIEEYSKKFSIDRMASNYISVFNSVINNKQ